MAAVADAKYRSDILRSLKSTPDDELRDLIANLGGHDLPKLIEVLQQADAVDDGPAVVFAYTVKGWVFVTRAVLVAVASVGVPLGTTV